jgi:hypothetical protein
MPEGSIRGSTFGGVVDHILRLQIQQASRHEGQARIVANAYLFAEIPSRARIATIGIQEVVASGCEAFLVLDAEDLLLLLCIGANNI